MNNLLGAFMRHLLPEDELLSNEELLRKVIREVHIRPLRSKDARDARNLLLISEGQDPARSLMTILKAHTDGLSFSPPQSRIAATHYVRRSAVLEKFKLYKEALQDIDLAFEHPMSNEEKNEICLRRESITRILEGQKSKVEDAKEEVTLSYGENDTIPGASSAITFGYNETDGRHLVATRPIEIGDIIMIEKPYAFWTTQDPEDPRLMKNPKYVCHNCLHYSMASIPCDKCIRAIYCSKKCRTEAYDKFHRIECQLPTANEVAYNLGLRLLMITTQQGERLQEVINLAREQQNCLDKLNAGFRDGKFEGNSVEAVLSLPNYMDNFKETAFTRQAGHLAGYINIKTDLLSREIDVVTIGVFILLLIYTFEMNYLEIERESSSDIVALGLYPLIMQMKHSCVANTMMYTDKYNNKIVYAVRDIEKGEQITRCDISYRQISTMSVRQRKDFVDSRRKNVCKCEACENNYTFKFELKNKIEVPEDLTTSLRENPKDVKSLWKLLKLIHDQYKSPCLEAKLVELGILDALKGKQNIKLSKAFSALGIV